MYLRMLLYLTFHQRTGLNIDRVLPLILDVVVLFMGLGPLDVRMCVMGIMWNAVASLLHTAQLDDRGQRVRETLHLADSAEDFARLRRLFGTGDFPFATEHGVFPVNTVASEQSPGGTVGDPAMRERIAVAPAESLPLVSLDSVRECAALLVRLLQHPELASLQSVFECRRAWYRLQWQRLRSRSARCGMWPRIFVAFGCLADGAMNDEDVALLFVIPLLNLTERMYGASTDGDLRAAAHAGDEDHGDDHHSGRHEDNLSMLEADQASMLELLQGMWIALADLQPWLSDRAGLLTDLHYIALAVLRYCEPTVVRCLLLFLKANLTRFQQLRGDSAEYMLGHANADFLRFGRAIWPQLACDDPYPTLFYISILRGYREYSELVADLLEADFDVFYRKPYEGVDSVALDTIDAQVVLLLLRCNQSAVAREMTDCLGATLVDLFTHGADMRESGAEQRFLAVLSVLVTLLDQPLSDAQRIFAYNVLSPAADEALESVALFGTQLAPILARNIRGGSPNVKAAALDLLSLLLHNNQELDKMQLDCAMKMFDSISPFITGVSRSPAGPDGRMTCFGLLKELTMRFLPEALIRSHPNDA